MKKLIIFFFVTSFLSSCDKENIGDTIPDNGIPPFLKLANVDYDVDASISIIANDYTFSNAHPVSLSISGYFKPENELAFIDNLKVQSIDIPTAENGAAQYSKYFSSVADDITEYNNLANVMGSDISIEVNDDIFPSFQENIYFPKKMKLNNFSSQQVSKNSDLSINWEKDVNGNKVAILILYQRSFSVRQDSSLPNEDISITKYIDDVNETVTFTTAELAQFPSNGTLAIFIGRGNQKVIEIEGKKVLVNTATYQMTHDFTIID
jgi:hypothetical protein